MVLTIDDLRRAHINPASGVQTWVGGYSALRDSGCYVYSLCICADWLLYPFLLDDFEGELSAVESCVNSVTINHFKRWVAGNAATERALSGTECRVTNPSRICRDYKHDVYDDYTHVFTIDDAKSLPEKGAWAACAFLQRKPAFTHFVAILGYNKDYRVYDPLGTSNTLRLGYLDASRPYRLITMK